MLSLILYNSDKNLHPVAIAQLISVQNQAFAFNKLGLIDTTTVLTVINTAPVAGLNTPLVVQHTGSSQGQRNDMISGRPGQVAELTPDEKLS